MTIRKPIHARAAGVPIAALAFAMTVAGCSSLSRTVGRPLPAEPPTPREFRAAWIATVANIDWPSEPGLPTSVQQSELRSLLDRAVALNLNAVVLQVRPAADALYASPIEPWSEYLTGAMGRAPDPYYDPLAFAVDEAHRRGLELHAWFNPFRAHHPTGTSPISENHISETHPGWVVAYGDYLWIDPGFEPARRYSLDVMLDVVRRYDIDGVHMDDYFYPYQIADSLGETVPFPDVPSYAVAIATGLADADTVSLNDWRRSNVDRFVETLYREVKTVKPWVKVGISPFGIWRPGYPEQIKGYDAYDKLYADSRRWLREGWVDYFSPQLYWSIDGPSQSYPVLLGWWQSQNIKDRHIWPGNFTSRVIATNSTVWQPDEIIRQIETTRAMVEDGGNIHFSMKSLLSLPTSMGRLLESGPYSTDAVVPASPWLSAGRPDPPLLSWQDLTDKDLLEIRPGPTGSVRLWSVKMRYGYEWITEVRPAWLQQAEIPKHHGKRVDEVVVRAIDRVGIESLPATIGKR